MRAISAEHLLVDLEFKKSAHEIVEKAGAKSKILRDKIEERRLRVAALRAEYDIDDAALVQLLQAARKQSNVMRFSYTKSMSNQAVGVDGGSQMEERTIGAGVVNNLLTENDFIASEQDQVERLDLIARNLKPIRRFAGNGTEIPSDEFGLSYDELTYLGF